MKAINLKHQIKKIIVFFISSLLVLSIIRVALFLTYKTTEITFLEFLPAAWMGFRVDAKWLATLMIPAWVLFCISIWKGSIWRLSAWFGGMATVIAILLSIINFGFYDFYRTPISPIIFGLFQDDTVAILRTLLNDWPIVRYLICIVILIALPFALVWIFCKKNYSEQIKVWKKKELFLVLIIGTTALGGIIRGSLGTFPLRQQNYAVSTNVFINSTVPGGLAALYEAWKGQKIIELKGKPETALTYFGFNNIAEAISVIDIARPDIPKIPPMTTKPNVVLAIMESMGRDSFDLHSETCNTLGSLADELQYAVVFRNGISVNSGTFPSLEGILFDTPITPLTQSRYGDKSFTFSRVFDFKREGYKTIFLTAGSESWRQIDVNFLKQGFDEVIGANAIKSRYPEAQIGTWGIGDKWMFQMANEILEKADKDKNPVFLVILSATNHPPHKVPDNDSISPVVLKGYPLFVTDNRKNLMEDMLKTYQYSSNALGNFVHKIRVGKLKQETLIVATGDHNARLRYELDGWWHHANGVPIIFWLPESIKDLSLVINKFVSQMWVSHRDIFPTIEALTIGKDIAKFQGRNLFANERFDLATAYTGFGKFGWGIGSWGAISLTDAQKVDCYFWNNDKLVLGKCTKYSQSMAEALKAQRAIVEYNIRDSLLKR